MIRIGTKTRLSPEEVVKRAAKFFGDYGLTIKEETPTCIYFEGGGGGVDVVTCVEEKETSVDLVSREWDHQVKEFIGKITS